MFDKAVRDNKDKINEAVHNGEQKIDQFIDGRAEAAVVAEDKDVVLA